MQLAYSVPDIATRTRSLTLIRLTFAPPSCPPRSVLPSFSFPDVDFFVWVFGRRYRRIIRSWDLSVDHPSSASKRINWSGAALSAFYSSVRKALICAIVLRAIWTLLVLLGAGWWVWELRA